MGFMDLIDNKLEKLFNSKPDNQEKITERRRNGVLAGIDNALASLKKGEAKGPRGWYTTKGNVTRCTVRTGTRTVAIAGRDHVFVPSERAVDFYSDLRKHVASKGMDADIDAAHQQSSAASTSTRTSARKGKPLDPEKVHQRNIKRYGEARANELRNKRK